MEDTNLDLSYLRICLQQWLDDHSRKLNWLAITANLTPSVLWRFMKKNRPIEASSILRLYNVIRNDMAPNQSERFLEAACLRGLVAELARGTKQGNVTGTDTLGGGAANPITDGVILMRTSMTRPWRDAVPLLLQAERAFGPGSTMAAYCACDAAANLINLGDLAQAETHLLRAAETYERIMDPMTKAHYSVVRANLEYDRGNLLLARHWHMNCITIAEAVMQPSLADESHLYMSMIALGLGKSASGGEQETCFNEAERWMQQTMTRHQKAGVEDWVAGLDYLRRGQLRFAQGKVVETDADIAEAHRLLRGNVAEHHVDIHVAETALEDGNTAQAVKLATSAIEDWSANSYAGGMGRSMRIMASAAHQEGHSEQALEMAIAAACINPYGVYDDRAALIQATADAYSVVRCRLSRSAYSKLLKEMRARADEKTGVFHYLNSVTTERSNDIQQVFARYSTVSRNRPYPPE